MTSFRKFLEIAVNSDMDIPSGFKSPRNPMAKIHREDDPSHKIIPFVVHPKMIDPMEEILHKGGKHAQALGVFERVLEQPRDGGMLMVNISNLEADDLNRMGLELVADSEKMMSSTLGGSIKDEAMKWLSFGNNLKRSVKNGIEAAARQKQNPQY